MEIKNMLTKKTTFNAKDSGLLFTLGVVIVQAAAFVTFLPIKNETVLQYIMIAVIQAIMFFTCYIYCRKQGMDFFKAVKVKPKIDGNCFFVALGLGIATLYIMIVPLNLYVQLLESIGLKIPEDTLTFRTPQEVALGAIFISLLPAICEETLFRGVVLQGLRRFGDFYAVIVSAALFMLMHANPLQTPFPFVMGIVLGIVFIKTGNLIYSSVIHFVNNFLSVIFDYLSHNIKMPEVEEAAVFMDLTAGNLIVIAVMAAIFAACLYYLLKQRTVNDEFDSPKIFKTPSKIPGGLGTILRYADPFAETPFSGNAEAQAGGFKGQDDGFAVTQNAQGVRDVFLSEHKMQDDGFAADTETPQGGAAGLGAPSEAGDADKKSVYASNNIFVNAQELLAQGFLYDEKNGLFVLPYGEYADIAPPLGFADVTKDGKYNDKYTGKKAFILRSLGGIIVCGATWILSLIMSLI